MSNKEKEFQNDFSNSETNTELDALKEELDDDKTEEIITDKNDTEKKDRELEELQNIKEELEEYKDKYIRLNAEFQNYKRRTEKEKKEIYEFGSEKVILDMLGVLDNLERAIDTAQKDIKDKDGLFDGIQMIYKQFKDVLSKHGVQEISSLKQKFDPNLHHAVIQEEVKGVESNIVLEVYEKGYLLKSKVIRPSMVKVSK